MRAINHALTGAIIGLTIESPVVAMPAAFLSHYVMDAIPHYDYDGDRSGRWIGSKRFALVLILDAGLCFLVVVMLALFRPSHWVNAAACAFLAALPDAFSFMRFRHIRNNEPHIPNRYERFASKIQWFERPIGAVVEITWFFAAVALFALLVH